MKRNGGPLAPVLAAFRGEQLRPTVVLLISPLLMVSWWYLGAQNVLFDWISPRLNLPIEPAAAAAICNFGLCFLLLGVVPALIVKLGFRQRLADYGVGLGIPTRTARSLAIWTPVFVLIAYLSSLDPAIKDYYPISRIDESGRPSPGTFGLHACTYALFYLGWEFHFRGFVQFGLRERLGDANAVLVQVMASCLLHLGKPGMETYASIAGGLLWGMLAYRTRSLLSGLVQHLLLGIMLDWFI